jgi:hypothetical protein
LLTESFRILNGRQWDCRAQSISIMRGSFIPTSSSADVKMSRCQEYGIQLDHRPVGRPHFAGHIEPLIGTMTGAVHLLPGTTFSNVDEKGAYESEKRALLT